MSDYEDFSSIRRREDRDPIVMDGGSMRSRRPLPMQDDAYGTSGFVSRDSRAGRDGGGRDRDRRSYIDEEPPKLYSIHRAKVTSVQAFGAFCSLPGFKKQGLVHISQVSNYKVDSLAGIVDVGDSVYVKVIKIETAEEGGRIGLNMKYVDQTTGADSDPNNVQLMLTDKQKKAPREGRAPISLDAILNTICSKCGSKGHLAIDCFGQKYDFVTSDDEKDAQLSVAPPPPKRRIDELEAGALALAQQAKDLKRKEDKERKEAKRLRKEQKKIDKEKKREKKKERKEKKEKKKHKDKDEDKDSKKHKGSD
eukprot:TRINITY_DN7782_c0_g1_i2.p1 TRINITY_DN7782_c0_g1~~TRINITY_DN7782_c0_g1_i2.p1  ORF type:complete len:308 (+),score=93.00 TRINITY_DN7782_c0_g1_i2:3-926(+)